MKVFCGATCPLLIGISAAVLRSGGMTIRRLLLRRRYIGILAYTGCCQSEDSRKSCAITTATTTSSTKRFHVCAAAEALVPIGARRPSGAQGPASLARSLARSLGAFTTVVFTDRQPASASQAAAAEDDDDDAFLDKLIFICRSSIRSAIFFDRPAFNLDNQVDSIRYITVLCCSMDG